MFELRNVSKQYQNNLSLQTINFTVSTGEIVGVVGKSGAGKSTLLRLLNLMEPPTSGELLLDGINTAELSKKIVRKEQQQMGMIFQKYNLLENLTIYDNVALPLKLLHREDSAKVNQLLEFVGMENKKDNYPVELSGGEQQRVSIARALSRNPKWLFCDEATSSLDEENTDMIIALLRKVHQEFRPTIFFVSHELETVKKLCERVLVLEEGKLIGDIKNDPTRFTLEELPYLTKVERSLRK